MSDTEFAALIGAAVGAGVATLVSAVVQIVNSWRQRVHDREQPVRAQRLAERARLQVRLEDARDDALPRLLGVLAFVTDRERAAAEVAGFMVAEYPSIDERVADWGRALGELQRLSLMHPDSDFREAVDQVREQIQSEFVDPIEGPELETLTSWSEDLRALANRLHELAAPPG